MQVSIKIYKCMCDCTYHIAGVFVPIPSHLDVRWLSDATAY